MQLTIDLDKNFIETLKKEFHTPDIKDALTQLFNFYKEIHPEKSNLDKELNHRIEDYKNGSMKTTEFHDGLNDIRETLLAKL